MLVILRKGKSRAGFIFIFFPSGKPLFSSGISALLLFDRGLTLFCLVI